MLSMLTRTASRFPELLDNPGGSSCGQPTSVEQCRPALMVELWKPCSERSRRRHLYASSSTEMCLQGLRSCWFLTTQEMHFSSYFVTSELTPQRIGERQAVHTASRAKELLQHMCS